MKRITAVCLSVMILSGLAVTAVTGCGSKGSKAEATAKGKGDPQWVTKGKREVKPDLDKLH